MNILQDLFYMHEDKTSTFFDRLNCAFGETSIKVIDSTNLNLIEKEFIEELKSIPDEVSMSFGKSLRDIKCTIKDDENLRHHDIYIKYNGLHILTISHMNLPYSQLQDRTYSSIEDIVTIFRQYINSLNAYFHELECIDQTFTVVEPLKPTFKDDYRRILLDERTWLHVEVTIDGLATNIHLIGQSEHWNEKLQAGLLAWDHDKHIVENIMIIFELMKMCLPVKQIEMNTDTKTDNEVPSCAICFCVELPDNPGVPQPLCQNFNCGVYFHKSCLFQWLVACEGGRPPAFGVANGSCPTCLQPVTCSEKDN